MAAFSHHLDDSSLEVLFRMVDTTCASTLYASHLHVSASEIWSESFSFVSRPESGFVCLRSDWADTPKAYLDFHRFSLARESVPSGAARGAEGGLLNASVIREWEGEAARLASLSILQRQEREGDEEVSYDKALLFESVAGARYAIFAEGIAGGVRFTRSADVLERLASKTTVRAHRRRNTIGRGTLA